MVIDVNDELLLKIDETRAINVGTFNDEDCVVWTGHRRRNANCIGARKFLVRMRRWIAHDDLDIFVERA